MPAMNYAQWFEKLGRCGGCSKAATGTLRSFYANNSLGVFCEGCAKKEIAAAHRKGKFEPDAVLEEREIVGLRS